MIFCQQCFIIGNDMGFGDNVNLLFVASANIVQLGHVYISSNTKLHRSSLKSITCGYAVMLVKFRDAMRYFKQIVYIRHRKHLRQKAWWRKILNYHMIHRWLSRRWLTHWVYYSHALSHRHYTLDKHDANMVVKARKRQFIIANVKGRFIMGATWRTLVNSYVIASMLEKFPLCLFSRYSDVIMSAMASEATARWFAQPFVQSQITENTNVLRHWTLWAEFTGERWIPLTNEQ